MKKHASILLLFMSLVMTPFAPAAVAKMGSISGKVMIKDGVPMANGAVFFFNEDNGPSPSFDMYWRVPDETVVTDAEGKFKAPLVDGKYYIGAIKRKSGDEIGPLQEGDLFLPFLDNGKPTTYAVTDGSSADIGTVAGAQTFTKSILKTGEGITAIKGMVADAQGNPIENVLVFAFLSPGMVGKPLFISEKTGKDGKYLLRVNKGSSYYLKIRSSYGGGAMRSGETMGYYGGEKPLAVEVKTGTTVPGIDIKGTGFNRKTSGRK